jgi:hypothetical protein
MGDKAVLAMLDRLLVLHGFCERIFRVTNANKVEQLRPQRLACNKLK